MLTWLTHRQVRGSISFFHLTNSLSNIDPVNIMNFTKQALILGLSSVASVSAAKNTILDIVVASEAHNTLEAAVMAAPSVIAGLLSSDSKDGLTLFAPDDAAFATLPEGTVELLVSEPYTAHLVCVLAGTSSIPSSMW